MKNYGVWLVGALGSIGVTVMTGGLALRRGLMAPDGMVTENEIYRSETKSLKIPSCRIEKDFLKKIYQLIYDSNNLATGSD